MSDRVSVLLLLPGFGAGGLEHNALRWVRLNMEARWHFVAAGLDPAGPLRRELLDAGVPVEDLGFRGFATPALLNTVRRLKDIMRRHDVRIVHAFNQGPTLLGALASIGSKAKLISSRRSLSYAGGLPRPALWFGNRSSHHILANSRAVECAVLAEPGVEANRLSVVPTGVPVRRTTPHERAAAREKWGCLDGDFVIAWVATLRPVKQPHVFFSAVARLARQRRVRVLVAGAGPLRPALERSVELDGLAEHVHFLGHVDDPSSVYQASDVYVLTSNSEGLPTAVLEAQAHGTAVIATAAGGTVELIEDGQDGILVPVGDVGALHDALAELSGDEARRRRLAMAAQARVEREFDERSMVRRLQECYDAAL